MRDINAYKCLDYKDKVVMDIGGCFGGFCHRAKQWGAKKIISYEAFKDNYETLKFNCDKMDNVICINRAMISGHEGTCDFYPARGKSLGVGSRLERRGRVKTKVLATNFSVEMNQHRPEILKVDIEGGEYDLFFNTKIPHYVKQVVMEIHLIGDYMKYNQCPKLLEIFKDWDVVKKHSITSGNLTTTAAWRR